MSYNKSYLPSNSERETPWELYYLLNREFAFMADMAATEHNAKHHTFFTVKDDSLSIEWPHKPVFCNPPYSRGLLPKFVKKAREEAINGCHAVLLLPVSTSSGWWMDYVASEDYNLRTEIRFLAPRVPFLIDGKPMLSKSGKPVGAMTPNVIVYFSPHVLSGPRMNVYWYNWKEEKYY